MPLTSESNPRVKRVVRLRKSSGSGGRRATGRFLAEGGREVSRAVAAGLAVDELYVCDELAAASGGGAVQAAQAVEAAVAAGAERVDVSERVLKKMTYHAEPEGVLAVVRRPATGLDALPAVTEAALPTAEEPLPGAGVGVGGCWLVAVGTEKPGNLGAMVRTAEAMGCGAVIAAGAAVDAFHPNAIRASTGAVFSTPIAVCDEADAIAALRERGLAVVAAAVAGAVSLDALALDPAGSTAVVIGPEDDALGPAWLELARDSGGAAVRVPMAGRGVDSLNASVTAGVVLHDVMRRRRPPGI